MHFIFLYLTFELYACRLKSRIMEILPAVPDELFSDTFSSAALGLEEEGSDAADIKVWHS